MWKRLAMLTSAVTMLVSAPVYAGQWMQDDNGRWRQDMDGSYPFMTWAWINGDHDGIAENFSLMRGDSFVWIRSVRECW